MAKTFGSATCRTGTAILARDGVRGVTDFADTEPKSALLGLQALRLAAAESMPDGLVRGRPGRPYRWAMRESSAPDRQALQSTYAGDPDRHRAQKRPNSDRRSGLGRGGKLTCLASPSVDGE